MISRKLLYFVFFTTSLFGQKIETGLLTYRVSFSNKKIEKYNTTEKQKIKDKKVSGFWGKVYDPSSFTESILTFNSKESIFKIKNELDKSDALELNILKVLAGDGNVYYSNIKNESLTQNCTTLGDCFLITNDKRDWEITQETKEIQGYLCYKATTIEERKNKEIVINAWFTLSFPFNYGPLIYNGLPGLVLELDDGLVNFSVSKIELNPKRKIEIKKPTKGIKVTKKEFLELLRKSVPKGW